MIQEALHDHLNDHPRARQKLVPLSPLVSCGRHSQFYSWAQERHHQRAALFRGVVDALAVDSLTR